MPSRNLHPLPSTATLGLFLKFSEVTILAREMNFQMMNIVREVNEVGLFLRNRKSAMVIQDLGMSGLREQSPSHVTFHCVQEQAASRFRVLVKFSTRRELLE